MTELEEIKDESLEKENFLNKGETLFQITRDNYSLFRCLAHQTMKNQDLYEDVKTIVAKQL